MNYHITDMEDMTKRMNFLAPSYNVKAPNVKLLCRHLLFSLKSNESDISAIA